MGPRVVQNVKYAKFAAMQVSGKEYLVTITKHNTSQNESAFLETDPARTRIQRRSSRKRIPNP